jgi:hypothetical protein
MHRTNPFIRSVGGGEKRWRDDYQGTDNAQISVWVFTIYAGLRLCGDPPALHSDDQLMLDCGAGNSNVTQLGLHADYGGRNTVERNSRPFVANCPPTLALPLRSASKIYELQLMDPTFVSEWRKPKAVFFQGIGAGDGNRTHDIQLGKVFELSPLALLFRQLIPSLWR